MNVRIKVSFVLHTIFFEGSSEFDVRRTLRSHTVFTPMCSKDTIAALNASNRYSCYQIWYISQVTGYRNLNLVQMDEHVNTFRKCCCAIQTGINVVEANLWLSALTLEKSMCLPLCIAVIDGSDASTINSVFLASKIVHNFFRDTNYLVAIDLNYVQVSNVVDNILHVTLCRRMNA